MHKLSFCWLLGCLIPYLAIAQINYTANDQIIPYEKPFRYGANVGYYPPWQDQQLAEIAAGDPKMGLAGVGVNSIRPALFEHFFDYWGYKVRREAFDRYAELGMTENVGFLGYPSDEHRNKNSFCPNEENRETAVFDNLYADIWDNGENGTPVNEQNYYAAYVYKIVNEYKDQIRFWEVWNEPDFDYASNAWKNPSDNGNWWDNDPLPCTYALQAPAQYYVRMLRISYEVIKSIDPELYVCTGGLGYPSFLDVILRNTDNPDEGKVTSSYPLTGGAYFDVLSFHSYPHIDGSVRQWSNEIWDFKYQRHSDAAVAGYVKTKRNFENLLHQYGYNGQQYPEKMWICTETTVPRVKFDDNMGSELSHVNYIIKSLVASQKEQLHQYHIYTMADSKTVDAAGSPYDLMGLFYALENVTPYAHQPTVGGIAYKTTSDLLFGWRYDAEETAKLKLPPTADGGAFRNELGEFTYILWAKTTQDENELVSTVYTFPKLFQFQKLDKMNWDYAKTQKVEQVAPLYIQLNGSPSFFRISKESPLLNSSLQPYIKVDGQQSLKLHLPETSTITVKIVDNKGKATTTLLNQQKLVAGTHLLPLDVKQSGVYLIEMDVDGKRKVQKVIIPLE
ncbi:MAG: T9SS type A sorting domain-containing protein [Bacteroidota bacterium]